MVILAQLAALLAICSIVTVAAPTAESKVNGRFSLQQVAVPKAKAHPVAAYARTLQKRGLPAPKALRNGGENGSAEAFPAPTYDWEFLVEARIGTQKMLLPFDTGSADLWVFSTLLPEAEKKNHTLYEPGPTAELLQGYSWNMSYIDDSYAWGIVYLDEVELGGVVVKKQAVGAAQQMSAAYVNSTRGSGIIGAGLGWNSVQPTPQKTWFENAVSQLESPLFTANLHHQRVGSYDFGYIDPEKHEGKIFYTPVNASTGDWTFTVPRWSAGKASGGPVTAVADTDSSVSTLPTDLIKKYYEQVPSAKWSDDYDGWVFFCNKTLPEFKLHFDDYTAVIPSARMNYGSMDKDWCLGNIQPGVESAGGAWWGIALFESQFVVFDYGNKRLGFAPQKKSQAPSSCKPRYT